MLLSDEAIQKEISEITPMPAIDAGPEGFPYLGLHDEQFEYLNHELAASSAPKGVDRSWDKATVMVRGSDAGRDVLLTSGGVAAGVIQCKRLESSMPLPAVFREIAKLVLFAEVEGDLGFDRRLTYILSVARDPSGTVVDFFARPKLDEPSVRSGLEAATREVRETYKTLQGLDVQAAEGMVLDAFGMLDLHLLRPKDLDEWMGREPGAAGRFFRQRIVVDNGVVSDGILELKKLLEGIAGDVKAQRPITDEEVAALRADIEAIPESHRWHAGFAMFFGLPPEMFEDSAEMRARLTRLVELMRDVNGDYIDWVFKRARVKADEIADRHEWGLIPPYVRQLPGHFLSHVAKECVDFASSGDLMSGIVADLRKSERPSTDEERLQLARSELISEGAAFLAGDYTNLTGDEHLVALKKLTLSRMLHGLKDREAIEVAVDAAIRALRGRLFAAAEEFRDMCKHKQTIVLMGTRGLDGPNVLRRMYETFQKKRDEPSSSDDAGPSRN